MKKKRHEKEYSHANLEAAMKAVYSGDSIRAAAEKHCVPNTTLQRKISNSDSIYCKKGPSSVITPDTEKKIANWVVEMFYRKFPVTKARFLDEIEKYVIESELETPFKNNRPGRQWYEAFLRRHPEIAERLSQNLTTTRAKVTEADLRSWFADVKANVEKKNLLSLPPEQFFNLEKSAFKLEPNKDKVLAPKGARNVYNIVSAGEKTAVTILFNVSAAGKLAPPLILFEMKSLPKRSILNKIPKGWGVGITEGGWMTSESFYSYIVNLFHPWCLKNSISFSIIRYVDNHKSHVNRPLLEFCIEKLIELTALYPNSTHILQPLYFAFFRQLKVYYPQAMDLYKKKHHLINVKKEDVPAVLEIALNLMETTEEIIRNGFRTSGLHPFNPDAVNFDILKKK